MARPLVLTATVMLVACSDEAPPIAAPQAPTILGLQVSPSTATLIVGSTFRFSASKVLSNGALVGVTPLWESSNPSLVTIDPSGVASAVGAGQVTITAKAEGFVSTSAVQVRRPGTTTQTGPLVVEDFMVVELQYPTSDQWYYAPLLKLRAVPGRLLTLEMIEFRVGASRMGTWTCFTGLPNSSAIELNSVGYGEWDMMFGGPNRLGSDDVNAVIFYRDEISALLMAEVSGPINPGELPPYSSALVGACSGGYRPPGDQ